MLLHTLADDCKATLERLSKSPSFAMSRGGKELFHTNFIAFVLDTEPESMQDEDRILVAQTRAGLLRMLFGGAAPQKVLTWREKNNLDLVVVAAPDEGDIERTGPAAPEGADDRRPGVARLTGCTPLSHGKRPNEGLDIGLCAVIVEAKLKALPSGEQLQKYNERLAKGLSLELPDTITIEYRDEKGKGTKSFWWGRIGIKSAHEGKTADDGDGTVAASVCAYHTPTRAESDKIAEVAGEQSVPTRSSCFAASRGTVRRLLLAPDDVFGVAKDHGWKLQRWDDLLGVFPSGPAVPGESLMTRLLRDYAESTRQLLTVLDRTSAGVNEFMSVNQGGATLADLHAAVAGRGAAPFKQTRIHDLVGKRAYSLLEAGLRERVIEKLKEQGVFESLGGFKLSTYTFLSNATPGLCIEFKRTSTEGNRSVSIGVQIQGIDYRHFVSASHPKKETGRSLGDAANCLGKVTAEGPSGWWQIDDRTPPRVQNLNSKGDFFKFNADAFLYCKADVSVLDFAALSALVVTSMGRARSLVANSAAFRTQVDGLIGN